MAKQNGDKSGKAEELAKAGQGALARDAQGREVFTLDGVELVGEIDVRSFEFWRPQSDEHEHPLMISGVVIRRHFLPADLGIPSPDGELREAIAIRGPQGDWTVPIAASLAGQVGVAGSGGVEEGEYVAFRYDGKVKVKSGRQDMNKMTLFRQKRRPAQPVVAEVQPIAS